MSRHVIKYEYRDGKLLSKPVVWCGRKIKTCSPTFEDTQHVALAVGGSIQPCKSCIKAIIRQLSKEL